MAKLLNNRMVFILNCKGVLTKTLSRPAKGAMTPIIKVSSENLDVSPKIENDVDGEYHESRLQHTFLCAEKGWM